MTEGRNGRRNQPTANNTPVCIAGMHRSGTSMVAKLLQQAGLFLGDPSNLMPPAEENPEGFFEHLGFVRLNDELLNAAGAGWDCPPPAGFAWDDPALDPFRERAQELAAPLRPAGSWGWKDPRNSLTVPFWRSVFGPLRTVVVVRNPLEVVTSLHRRNGFSTALGLTLWQLYGERVLEDTTPEDRLVTHFDNYFLRPREELAWVLSWLGLEEMGDADSPDAVALPALRHHRKSARDLAEYGFPAAVIDLYRRLCREAKWWEGDAEWDDALTPTTRPAHVNATIARGLGQVDLIRVENDVLRRNNADFTARITELELALSAHEANRGELEGKIAERDSKVNERNALLRQQLGAIAGLQEQLAQRGAELSQLRDQLAAANDRLAERERDLEIAALHEQGLRAMFVSSQSIQLQRDAELMGTLGAVLSRHAPGAPASIYYRRLVTRVRQTVEAHVPIGVRVLVATYGDDAFLALGDRASEPFPQSTLGVAADYTDVSSAVAIAQLEALRGEGAEYLVVSGTAQPWLATHPELERHLDDGYATVFHERGLATIYALGRRQGLIPA